MKIEKNKVVTVTYDLYAGQTEKSFVETADKQNPFVFLYGGGGLIEDFEKQLHGLKVGDKFEFDIESQSAYGEIDTTAIVELPIDLFKVEDKIDDEMLTVGNMVPMTDEEGNRLNGKVVKVTDTDVTMDFNHPLAGQNLHFSGEVIEIRDAVKEEIEHGHVHAHGDHHHH